MVVVRTLGWLLFAVGGLLDLWLMVASSAVVAARHGVLWVVLGWVFFPVGVFALPIAAGMGVLMVLVYAVTVAGAGMVQAGER